MALVIGKGKKFYDIPDELLTQYALPEDKVAKIKANVKKASFSKDDVEGYSQFDSIEEGMHEQGKICNYWHDDDGPVKI